MYFTIYGILTWMKYNNVLLSFLESVRVMPRKYGNHWDPQDSYRLLGNW